MIEDDFTYMDWLQKLASGCAPSNGRPLEEDSVFSNEDVQLALFLAVRMIEAKLPAPLEPEEQREALQRQLGEASTFPTAMAAAEAIAGVPFRGTSQRFSKGVWFAVDPPSVGCPSCKSDFLAFRSPYTTKAGHTYFYWALACPQCQTVVEPASLPEEQRKLVYKASRHRPQKP